MEMSTPARYYEAHEAPTHQSEEATTPKLKSQSPVELDAPNNSGHELDPLIDALLDHLPAPGDPFPPEERKLWMQILDLILKLIHPDESTAESNGGDEQQPEQPGQPEPRR